MINQPKASPQLVNSEMWYIYLVKSSACDDVYIGSTSRSISSRFAEHLYQFRVKKGNCSVNRILENGIEHVTYEILEQVDTNDRRDLLQRERYWIEQNHTAINQNLPARDTQDTLRIYSERAKEKRRAITKPTKCECGYTYYYGRKNEHDKTRRHIAYLSKLSSLD